MNGNSPGASNPHYAVQARLIEHRHGVVVRDETRIDTATTVEAAVRDGRRHIDDGFTVWIYHVEDRSGTRPTYVTVETLRPELSPVQDARSPRRRAQR